MEVGEDQNRIEILAEAAAMQNDIQVNDLVDGNPEVEEAQEFQNMEIVVGLAAVPGVNAGEMFDEGFQNVP